jgi:hypothetical protein
MWAKGKSHSILEGIPKMTDPWKDQGKNKKTILKFILRIFSLSEECLDQEVP